MKKLIYFVAVVTCGMIGLVSCMDDSNNDASATQDFFARPDSIVFEDSNDVVFEAAVDTALQSLGVLSRFYYPQTLFTEEASVNLPSIDMAVQQCVKQADETYKKKLANVTRDLIERKIQVMLLPTEQPLDSLDGFTVYYNLMYFYGNLVEPKSVDQYIGVYRR